MENEDSGQRFPLFPVLPGEIRMQIWGAALAPRIVKRKRDSTGTKITFEAHSKSLPLLAVCRESRAAAFLYGKYQPVASTSKIYFSSHLDFLWIDPAWSWTQLSPDSALPEEHAGVRNLMVNPNWNSSNDARRPRVMFAHLRSVQNVLVATDEKAIPFHTEIMMKTMEDVTRHYEEFASKHQNVEIPYIAVGCLGWIGNERRKIHHDKEDKRELVAIFENSSEMKAHLVLLRKEWWHFTQTQSDHQKIIRNLQRLRTGEILEHDRFSNLPEMQEFLKENAQLHALDDSSPRAKEAGGSSPQAGKKQRWINARLSRYSAYFRERRMASVR